MLDVRRPVAVAPWLQARGFLDIFKPPGDPRVGSGRQDSPAGGTLSTASNSKSSSLGKLGSTFIPVVVYLAACVALFVVLRRRCSRVYAPRTLAGVRPSATLPLPGGWLDWVLPFCRLPDAFVLNHGSLDGFFFLRFLKVLRNLCLGGCLIIWPVLFPIHATGGGGLAELDLLTIGNVKDPRRLYAHAVMAWVFFGFVLYMVVRECIYYVNLRQAYLSSPFYADRVSARTLLLTCVPKEYLDERRLRRLYGDSVRRIHIPRTSKALANLVKEREQTAARLEKAEVELIRKANAARQKHMNKAKPQHHRSTSTTTTTTDSALSRQDLVGSPRSQLALELPGTYIEFDPSEQKPPAAKDGAEERAREKGAREKGAGEKGARETAATDEREDEGGDDEYAHPYGLEPDLPDVRGSVAARWLPVEARPYHRPLGNFGRRVDTIRWTRNRLRDLNGLIFKTRRQIRRGDGTTLPAAFVEFDSQESAQAAHQVVAHHRPLHMSSRLLGICPDDILWKSLRMPWWERIARRFAALSLITAAVIFWSIPSAFIGLISQVDYLATHVVFLAWIKQLPSVVLNFLQGFVPSIALSLWMAAVPIMLRALGEQAGIPSRTMVELFVQKAYFAFQVVQVFLVTTLTSAASAAFTDILESPIKAKDILATNLPMASNFYLSYILIQCLASSGTNLLQVFSLIRHYVLSKFTTLPRARFKAWHKLRPARWGGVFPVFANMGVIALSYACIAPLILVFAAGGMAVMHVIWRYNLMFVLDSDVDSKGLFYPRALLHLIVGLYLAEICLIGLFALHLSFGPLAMMVLFFLFTGLVHLSLRDAIAPLLLNLPQTLALEEDVQQEDKAAAERAKEQAKEREAGDEATGGAASSYYDPEQAFGDEGVRAESDEDDEDDEDHDDEGDLHGPVTSTRAVEGASGVKAALTEWFKTSTKAKVRAEAQNLGLGSLADKARAWTGLKRDDGQPPGWLARWLHPEVYEDFVALRRLIPARAPDPAPDPAARRCLGKHAGYQPPEMWLPKPTLWIPRDEARVSRQEVAHTRKFTPISDRGAVLDEKGRVVLHFDQAPFSDPRLVL